ncbi:MAG: XdhC/CoxI family protein [Chthoniobacterales bacterium]
MITDFILSAVVAARAKRTPCATITVAATTGSVPRSIGAKMLVYLNGETIGTIGGGKLESLAVGVAFECIGSGQPLLKTYPLREDEPDSFGAICGGEVTLFFEPIARKEALFLIGAGHCARAIAKLAADCDFHVSIIDERADELALCDMAHEKIQRAPAEFISSRDWKSDDALILVSRNFLGDQDALAAILTRPLPGYVGMIGSRRKVLHVFDELRRQGCNSDLLARVHAPIGLDIGADSPIEIAISVLAEVMLVLRGRSGSHLSLR